MFGISTAPPMRLDGDAFRVVAEDASGAAVKQQV